MCAIITPSHIICANVGDSRCVVGTSDRKAISLSEDHKPSLKDEKKRILAAGNINILIPYEYTNTSLTVNYRCTVDTSFSTAGGTVSMDRVNGELAMSRALGDYQYKMNVNLDDDKQMVSCYPDIATHVRSSVDHLLVLACDGVWDVMSNVDSLNFLQDIVLEEDKEISSAAMADALIELAFGAGSTDNISAIIVKLGNTVSKKSDSNGADDRKSQVIVKKRKLAE